MEREPTLMVLTVIVGLLLRSWRKLLSQGTDARPGQEKPRQDSLSGLIM